MIAITAWGLLAALVWCGPVGAGEDLPPDQSTPTAVAPPPPPRPVSSLTPTLGVTPNTVLKDCPDCPELMVLPAGEFLMGTAEQETPRNFDEEPQHPVSIPAMIAVGRYAVTFEEWDACLADGGCNAYRPDDRGVGRGRRPVDSVSWEDAQSYVRWLGKRTKLPYRLLTEAEWEYAARAETTTRYFTGPGISTDQANFDGRFFGVVTESAYRGKSLNGGSFPANPFGLYDMHGNLSQWVEDCYHPNYTNAPGDGTAWISEACPERVIRGSSWNYLPDAVRSAHRFKLDPKSRYMFFGFRVARSLVDTLQPQPK